MGGHIAGARGFRASLGLKPRKVKPMPMDKPLAKVQEQEAVSKEKKKNQALQGQPQGTALSGSDTLG